MSGLQENKWSSRGSSGFAKKWLFGYSIQDSKHTNNSKLKYMYSKTCLKRPIKNRQNKGLNDKMVA